MPAHTFQSNKWLISGSSSSCTKCVYKHDSLERRQAKKPCQFLRHCDKRENLEFSKKSHSTKWTRFCRHHNAIIRSGIACKRRRIATSFDSREMSKKNILNSRSRARIDVSTSYADSTLLYRKGLVSPDYPTWSDSVISTCIFGQTRHQSETRLCVNWKCR